MKNGIPFIILFIGVMIIALMPPAPKHMEKVTTCHIESGTTKPKEAYSPELINKYWTDCEVTFESDKIYKTGDSIHIKTIIIN